MNHTQRVDRVALDPDLRSSRVQEFEAGLRARVIGQDRAVRSTAALYQVFQAGLSHPNRPLGTMLFLGPTGSGKTRLVEAAAETLFDNTDAIIKIDCAEFQHSHEIAKLIGSPPGYLGHKETPPLLSQEHLDRHHTKEHPFALVLFDEIEKASDALWQLLLGILDKATLTLGSNQRVDFSQCLIFMTSNLGARQISELVTDPLGFAPSAHRLTAARDIDQKVYHTALESARRHFSPEFMNRIDKVVVFRHLKQSELTRVLDLELAAVQKQILTGQCTQFVFRVSDQAKQFLLTEGTDDRYGARHLKRAVNRFIVQPLASLLTTEQIRTGDVVYVDQAAETQKLSFYLDNALESVAQAAVGLVQSSGKTRSVNRIAA